MSRQEILATQQDWLCRLLLRNMQQKLWELQRQSLLPLQRFQVHHLATIP